MPTFQLIIKGKVQGVFYRANAKKTANKFHISGWIKNTGEGNVEALITGSQENIEQFINWCQKGPEKAIVKNVIAVQKEEVLFDDFKIIQNIIVESSKIYEDHNTILK